MSTPRRKVNAGQDADRPLVLDSYGRLSRVPETGELEKVETQWADNRKVIDRVGAVLVEELKDGLSAWKPTRLNRGILTQRGHATRRFGLSPMRARHARHVRMPLR